MFPHPIGANDGAINAPQQEEGAPVERRFVHESAYAQAEERAAKSWAPQETDGAIDLLFRRKPTSPVQTAAERSASAGSPPPSPAPSPPTPTSRKSTPSALSVRTASTQPSLNTWAPPEDAGRVRHFRAQFGQTKVDAPFAWHAAITADKDVQRSIETGAPHWKVTYQQTSCGTRSGHQDGCVRWAVNGELAELLEGFANDNQVCEVNGQLPSRAERPVLQFNDGVPVWTDNPEQLFTIGRRFSELLDRELAADVSSARASTNAGVPGRTWNYEVPKNLHAAVRELYYNVIQATRTGAKQIILDDWKNRQLNDVVNRLGGAATHEEFVRKVCYAMVTNTESPERCGKSLYRVIRHTKRALSAAELAALRQ